LFAALARWFEPRTKTQWFGRTVRLADGTGFSRPDTKAKRQRWPYAGGQKKGGRFPTGKLLGLFCLQTGRLIALVEGTWQQHDRTLTRQLLGWLHAGEVLVADRAFGGWFFLLQLLDRKVDFVIRRHQARTLRSRRYRSWQEAWEKPHRPCGRSRCS
jgi:hypothetical protein